VSDDKKIVENVGGRPWLPFLLILVACGLAHLWCLDSQFYLDDFPQIRDNEIVRNGHFWEAGLSAWSYLSYSVEYRLFGTSPVGFHAVNWLIHAGIACVLFAFARDFLRGKWPVSVALFGALLFAVHPLASEIPNYARTQDLAWTTLFSLLAAWGMLRYMRQNIHRWKWLLLCVICISGATFSKGPGLIHALMMTGVVGLATLPPEWTPALRRYKWWLPAAIIPVIALIWLVGLGKSGLMLLDQWSNPRFIGHGLTICRVFWEFAWRGIVPVKLSADHQITETLVPAGAHLWAIPDNIALLAAAGLLSLTAVAVWLAWRKSTRGFGVCLLLFAGAILFRVLYLIPEFMPEYRIYPGMPWFCLGAAIALAAAWRWMFPTASPRLPAMLLLGTFAALSARRSVQWHDIHSLMADVLKQYPAQARALWELDDHDADAGNWKAIILRQERDFPEVRRVFIAKLGELAPGRELPTGNFSLAEVACLGQYALAVAHEKSPAQGIVLIDQLEVYMRAMKIDPLTNPTHWSVFRRAKALVLETAGKYQAALEVLEPPDAPPLFPADRARLSDKLKAAK
jgi:hypothetical protein